MKDREINEKRRKTSDEKQIKAMENFYGRKELKVIEWNFKLKTEQILLEKALSLREKMETVQKITLVNQTP